MSNIIKLTDKVDDTRFESIEDCLNRASERFREGFKDGFKPTGAVVIFVEDTNEFFNTQRFCSSLKTSEIILLLEITKHAELQALHPTRD